MLRPSIIGATCLFAGAALAQQPVGGAGAEGGPNGAGITAPAVRSPGLGSGTLRPRTPTGTATATGGNSAGGVPHGANSPSTDSGNAGAGGGVSPAQQ